MPLWHNTVSTSIIGMILSTCMPCRHVSAGYVAHMASNNEDNDKVGRIHSTVASAGLYVFSFRLHVRMPVMARSSTMCVQCSSSSTCTMAHCTHLSLNSLRNHNVFRTYACDHFNDACQRGVVRCTTTRTWVQMQWNMVYCMRSDLALIWCSANVLLWHNTASTSIIGTILSAHM